MDFLSLLNFLIFAYKYQPSVDWQDLTFLYPCEDTFQNKRNISLQSKVRLITTVTLFLVKCLFKDLSKGFNMYLHISYEKCPHLHTLHHLEAK